jgi:hypothetical protein
LYSLLLVELTLLLDGDDAGVDDVFHVTVVFDDGDDDAVFLLVTTPTDEEETSPTATAPGIIATGDKVRPPNMGNDDRTAPCNGSPDEDPDDLNGTVDDADCRGVDATLGGDSNALASVTSTLIGTAAAAAAVESRLIRRFLLPLVLLFDDCNLAAVRITGIKSSALSLP